MLTGQCKCLLVSVPLPGRANAKPACSYAFRSAPGRAASRRRMPCRASDRSDSDSDTDWDDKWSRFQSGIKDSIPRVEPGRSSSRPTGNSRQDQIRRQENAALDFWNQASAAASLRACASISFCSTLAGYEVRFRRDNSARDVCAVPTCRRASSSSPAQLWWRSFYCCFSADLRESFQLVSP